ncbi:MAG: hypothetical protein OEU76_02935 [Cyclobacteriaceae bacterium]|nr:hypothetical protein [Cyclobacteriaceae bacterium]
MDDREFDDIIKGKVEGFEGPEFDPTALAALHHQLASIKVVPWYVQYRTTLLAGTGMALCTLLIIWSQWYWKNQDVAMLENGIDALKAERQEMINLLNELQQIKNNQRDTVHTMEVRTENSAQYASLQFKIIQLEYELQKLKRDSQKPLARNEYTLPVNLPATDSDDAFYNSSEPTKSIWSSSSRVNPRPQTEESLRAVAGKELLSVKTNNQQGKRLSAKTLRNLEDHYQKGIGIKLGPVFEISKGIYPVGSSQFNFGVGLLADFILSPSLSLETGGIHTRRYYDIRAADELASIQLPGIDESAGDLLKAEVDYWMLEVPLNLKYRYPVSLKTHWLASIGYAPVIYLRQLFEYDYSFDDGSAGNNLIVRSDYQTNTATLYPGTLNFSIGLNHQLKNKKVLETSLFYRYGLGEMGMEQIKPNFLGVRGVYWFTLK